MKLACLLGVYTRSKLKVLQNYNQLLSKMSVDSLFDADWKDEVEDSVNGYSSLSAEAGNAFFDKEIEMGEIPKCVRKLRNTKTGGSDVIVGENCLNTVDREW